MYTLLAFLSTAMGSPPTKCHPYGYTEIGYMYCAQSERISVAIYDVSGAFAEPTEAIDIIQGESASEFVARVKSKHPMLDLVVYKGLKFDYISNKNSITEQVVTLDQLSFESGQLAYDVIVEKFKLPNQQPIKRASLIHGPLSGEPLVFEKKTDTIASFFEQIANYAGLGATIQPLPVGVWSMNCGTNICWTSFVSVMGPKLERDLDAEEADANKDHSWMSAEAQEQLKKNEGVR